MIKTFGQYAKLRDRKLREDDAMGAGVSASVGGGSSDQPMGNAGDVGAAFKDLAGSIANALNGFSGSQVLNGIVSSVMGNPQVPQRVKDEIKQKIAQKWSHVVDLNDSPEGQGPGLGNISGTPGPPPRMDKSMSNVIVQNPSDNLGIST